MGTEFGTGNIRVEILHRTKGSRRILKDTLGVFRDATSCLIHVAADHYHDIESLNSKDSLTAMERYCHKTKQNPDPEYRTFDVLFYKVPSYLRRAAIHKAVGHVSSHETRCAEYDESREFETSRGHHFTKMAPAFTYTPNACPTLYKKESFRQDGATIQIKAHMRNTWDWLEVGIPNRDLKCLMKAAEHGTVMNPQLVFAYNKFYLDFPVQYDRSGFQKDVPIEEQTVLGVDLGLNNGAVCSVTDASGTILARDFDPFKADTDRILHVINLIRKKSSTSGKGQSIAALYTKLDGLKDNFVKQLARWVVNLAVKYGVYGIVLENLTGLRGRGRGSLKSRVHHWAVAKIRDYLTGMALREGIRVFLINPRGTSMYAYDGSGKVTRDADNYSLCTFATGKRYNCDLSASYNIGARYFLRAYHKSTPATAWSEFKAKVPELSKRTTWTLHALRELHREMEARKASVVA